MEEQQQLSDELRQALSLKVHQRYVGGDETAAGWGGAFEEAVEGEGLVATRAMPAGSEVFLIDHLWCTAQYRARKQLLDMPVIRGNMMVLLDIEDDDEGEEDDEEEVAADEEEAVAVQDAEALLQYLGVSVDEAASMDEVALDGLRFPSGLEAYSLPSLFPACRALGLQDAGLEVSQAEGLCKVLRGFGALKAVWLNGNPLCGDEAAMAMLTRAAEEGGWEILNRQLTSSYGQWALLYLSDAQAPSEVVQLDLRCRGLRVLKPEAFGELTSLRQLDVRRNDGLLSEGGWTTSALPALERLTGLRSLRMDVSGGHEDEVELARRLPSLEWVNGRQVVRGSGGDVKVVEEARPAEAVDRVMDAVWPIVEPIRVAQGSGHHPELYWFVMDTPGLAVTHSSEPTLATVALREPRLGVTFSAFWPIRDIQPGDRATRDFLAGFPPFLSPADRQALYQGIWGEKQAEHEGSERAAVEPPPPPPPPPVDRPPLEPLVFPPASVAALPVWTDMPVLWQYLSDPRFPITDDKTEAAVLWSASSDVTPCLAGQYTTSMSGLAVMDDKCLMARQLMGLPTGLPPTYCLPEDLHRFLASVPADSHQPWIVKPPHLARGWDIVITRSRACILRHLQASDRLAVSAYLTDPDTYRGHKYDLRLYCLILGTHRVLIHEHFRIRLASRPYSLRNLEDLHAHLTNTTLGSDGMPAETLSKEDFIRGFAASHGGQEWPPVREAVDRLLAEAFGRLLQSEELGQGNPRARALVGVDVLLDSKLRPWLIEINASPNCLGLCEERPDFFGQVFAACFSAESTSDQTGFRVLLDRTKPPGK